VFQKLGHFSIMSSFIGGLAAGAIAISISLLLRIFFGGLFIPELASQTLFSLTPGQVESQAVETLGPLAKYSAFIGAVIANLILYGLIGLLPDALHKMNKSKNFRLKRYAGNSIQYSLAAYSIMVLAGILLLALTETNLQAKLNSIRQLAIYLVPPSIAFGFILSTFYEKILSSPSPSKSTMHPEEKKEASVTSKDDVDYKKRILLRAGIASAVALPILYYGLDSLLLPKKTLQKPSAYLSLLKSRPPPSGFEDPRIRPLLDSEITPTELFYRIDKNPVVPVVNAQDWKLTVKGLVDKPFEINYKELRDMPSVEQFATLECVSNKIGGDLISTAIWKGIHLRVLLDKVHMMAGVKYIVFRCSDGYDVGIPIERGLLECTILAYDMNGAALTAEHGYPLRAIVPGIYGMMNAKWLTEIELVDKVYEGYWQRKGWTNVANYNTHSVILIPGNSLARKRFSNLEASNVIFNERVPISGIAFAGDRGISKVEVSSDGGNSWKIARIKGPLSQYTWVLWTVHLDLSAKSNRSIIVRATDKTGKIQADEVTDPFPNGATGYDMINA
jgi:DMSO/TMAO reductase YedYZ molybdopterin-dependent catalytic subunit